MGFGMSDIEKRAEKQGRDVAAQSNDCSDACSSTNHAANLIFIQQGSRASSKLSSPFALHNNLTIASSLLEARPGLARSPHECFAL
jgi:hypothetical protein